MAERIGQVAHYWQTGMMPFFSPREMANIYARTIGAMAEAYVSSTRMATNMMFAGMEATRATTNYTRQNAKEASHITSNTARSFAQTAKETVRVQEGEGGGAAGSATGSFESKGGGSATTTTTRTTYTSEGTTGTSGTESGGSSTTAGMVSLSDTVPGITEKNRKKV